MDEQEARRRFGEARVARIATVRADGSPHVVPVVFALDGDEILSIVDAKPKRSPELQRLANIAAEPRVTLLVDHYEEDWNALWWVRADGTARVVREGPERDRAIELLHAKYPQYETWSEPVGAAVIVTVDRWRSWSLSGS
jgi:PPOX class probable F420-dependent enzyme